MRARGLSIGVFIGFVAAVIMVSAVNAIAQPGPPPPPPPPLQAPPAPPGNPVTTAKANLGKVLFWDEQMSSTRTTACGSCHTPMTGSSDARSTFANLAARHPGPDGIFGTVDDIVGSPGVPLNNANGTYAFDQNFGMLAQVTPRKSPSAVNAAYSPNLFWDGRATPTFRDPITNNIVLQNGAALESQILGPPVSDAEMAHMGRDWNDVAARIAASRPLALSPDVPNDLEQWINGRTYQQLFAEAFGTPAITPSRIAMAIATYERVLFSNQTPFDELNGGNQNALTPLEQQGLQVFRTHNCVLCHGGNRLTNDQFHYIGVRPVNDDLGRFEVTGNPGDRGAFKTPGLRNVELRAPYFHNGRFNTIEEVIDFYDRGGDFNAPNKDPRIVPQNLTPQEKTALAAFLRRPLTDQRVANATTPFDHPTLQSESACVPATFDEGTPGLGGFVPESVIIEPPVIGNNNFTVAVQSGRGAANATLVIDDQDPGVRTDIPAMGSFALANVQLDGTGAGDGWGSVVLAIPNASSLIGRTYFGRWYIIDDGASFGMSVSNAFTFTVIDVCGRAPCVGDIDQNRMIDVSDLFALLAAWGTCSEPACAADLDGDGVINVTDLFMLLSHWGDCPE